MHIYNIYSAAFLSQAVFSLAWSASVEIMFVHSPNWELPTCFESRGVPTSRKVMGCRLAAKSWAADLPQRRGLLACRKAVVGCRLAVKSWAAGLPQSREFKTKTDETRPDRLTTEKPLPARGTTRKFFLENQNSYILHRTLSLQHHHLLPSCRLALLELHRVYTLHLGTHVFI